MKINKILKTALAAGVMLMLAGCGSSAGQNVVMPTEVSTIAPTDSLAPTNTSEPTSMSTATPIPTNTPAPTATPIPTNTPAPTATLIPTNTPAPPATPIPTNTPTPTATPIPTNTPAPTATSAPTVMPTPESYVIVIDPGHQRMGMSETEPNGPGSEVLKAKVSSGTQGVSTGLPEYKLNLTVSLQLKEELTARGYTVIMTRETHDVELSNIDRAMIANEAEADAFIRVHANGASNSATNGVMTICQTKNNPYNSEWYESSRRLSELVLEEVLRQTGANSRKIWETDTMTGINWATVPATILEMGYMSNPEEDELMATEEYQKKIVKGVADAIDRFFAEKEAAAEE